MALASAVGPGIDPNPVTEPPAEPEDGGDSAWGSFGTPPRSQAVEPPPGLSPRQLLQWLINNPPEHMSAYEQGKLIRSLQQTDSDLFDIAQELAANAEAQDREMAELQLAEQRAEIDRAAGLREAHMFSATLAEQQAGRLQNLEVERARIVNSATNLQSQLNAQAKQLEARLGFEAFQSHLDRVFSARQEQFQRIGQAAQMLQEDQMFRTGERRRVSELVGKLLSNPGDVGQVGGVLESLMPGSLGTAIGTGEDLRSDLSLSPLAQQIALLDSLQNIDPRLSSLLDQMVGELAVPEAGETPTVTAPVVPAAVLPDLVPGPDTTEPVVEPVEPDADDANMVPTLEVQAAAEAERLRAEAAAAAANRVPTLDVQADAEAERLRAEAAAAAAEAANRVPTLDVQADAEAERLRAEAAAADANKVPTLDVQADAEAERLRAEAEAAAAAANKVPTLDVQAAAEAERLKAEAAAAAAANKVPTLQVQAAGETEANKPPTLDVQAAAEAEILRVAAAAEAERAAAEAAAAADANRVPTLDVQADAEAERARVEAEAEANRPVFDPFTDPFGQAAETLQQPPLPMAKPPAYDPFTDPFGQNAEPVFTLPAAPEPVEPLPVPVSYDPVDDLEDDEFYNHALRGIPKRVKMAGRR